jgi:hypothetical protein
VTTVLPKSERIALLGDRRGEPFRKLPHGSLTVGAKR